MSLTLTQHTFQRGETRLSSVLLLLLILAISWLLWSGLYKPLVMSLGALSCLLSVYLAHRMGFFRHHTNLLRLMPRLPGYWLWLLREIIISSLDVAKLILKPSMPISPTVVVLEVERGPSNSWQFHYPISGNRHVGFTRGESIDSLPYQ